MGVTFSCITKVPSIEALQYDMTPWKDRNLPVIWLAGQQNTGKLTQGNLIKDIFNFDHINVTHLLRDESRKDTERAAIIKEALSSRRNIPDNIVLDLIKEALLNSLNETGFVISNFPKNANQAELFVKEIGNVTLVLYLYSDSSCLIDRAQEKAGNALNEDILRKEISFASRDIVLSLEKYSTKTENIKTNGAPEEVFGAIEDVFASRLNLRRQVVVRENDYVRVLNAHEEL